MLQVLLLLKSASSRSSTFITMMMQIRTFSLNSGFSDKNFETATYLLERPFQKVQETFFSKFFRKHCVLTLSLAKYHCLYKKNVFAYIQFTLFHVFNYYRMSLQIFLFYKFFCTNLSQVDSRRFYSEQFV